MKYEKLNKKALSCIYVATFVRLIITSGMLIGVLLIFGYFIPEIVKKVIIGLIAIDVVESIISPKIRYERYRYSITEDCIDVSEGFLFIERQIVPIERIHKIALEKGPIDRMFNLSKVKVTTAGGDVTIRFLDDKKSEFIANTLKKKINEIAIESRLNNEENLV